MQLVGDPSLLRLLRSPLLHFLLLGSILFGVRALWQQAEPLRVDAAQMRALAEDHRRFHGRLPDTDELASLVDDWVDQELMVEAAYALGLHREDPVIRRRLSRKMELLSEDPDASAGDLFEQALRLGLDRSDPIVRRRLVHLMEQHWTAEGGPFRSPEADQRLVDLELERLRRQRGLVIEDSAFEDSVIEDAVVQDAVLEGMKAEQEP